MALLAAMDAACVDITAESLQRVERDTFLAAMQEMIFAVM